MDHKGKNNPCFGKKWTKKERERLSNALSDRLLSTLHRENLRKSSPTKKKICIDGVIYESIRQASLLLDIPHGTIWNRLKNGDYDNYEYLSIN
jgi:hypothetical protein